jgi:hypothetical protein
LFATKQAPYRDPGGQTVHGSFTHFTGKWNSAFAGCGLLKGCQNPRVGFSLAAFLSGDGTLNDGTPLLEDVAPIPAECPPPAA